MKPETEIVQKVTSLELSKALKVAGARQESEKIWYDGAADAHLFLRGSESDVFSKGTSAVAAFDCVELLAELPGYVSDGLKEYWLTLEKLVDEYHAMYCDYHHGPCGTAVVEVLGRLLLWGLENGHVKKSEGGS